MDERPTISAIIPTKNRRELLRSCLQALAIARRRFEEATHRRAEIIIVDDHSDEDIGPLRSEFPDIRIIESYGHGEAPARNTGLQAARGDFIATTDSDCTVAPDWLLRIYQHFTSHADCSAVQGIPWLYAEPHTLATRIEIKSVMSRMIAIAINHENATAHTIETRNVAFRKAIIDRQPERKLIRDEIPSDDDCEAGTRLAQRDRICWEPRIISYHRSIPSVWISLKHRYWYGRGFAYYSIREDARGQNLFRIHVLHQIATGVPVWYTFLRISALFLGYCVERISNFRKVQQYRKKYWHR